MANRGTRSTSLLSALSIKRASAVAIVETGLDTVVLIWLSRKTKAARVNGS